MLAANHDPNEISQVQKTSMSRFHHGASVLKIIIPSFFLLLSILFQLLISPSDFIFCLLSQLQMILTVFLVVTGCKAGYLCAVCLNLAGAAALALAANNRSPQALLFPLSAVVAATVIYICLVTLTKRTIELCEENARLSALCQNLDRQNKRLASSNLALKDDQKKLIGFVYYDALTGLPNGKTISKKVTEIINSDQDKTKKFAVAIIDIDNFKTINSSIGHNKGNQLLKSVVERLKSCVHKDDFLGRLSGDVFVVVTERSLKHDDLLQYAEVLRESFSRPVLLENTIFHISASIGLSIYPQDSLEYDGLLKCADEAMFRAKDSGKNSVRLFDETMEDEIIRKIEFKNKLQYAVANNELFLAFQPQYDVGSKRLRGFEALVRWRSPEFGIVSPAQFIPVAEETRLIVPIGEWILRKSCERFTEIQKTVSHRVLLSVNISAVQIMHPSFLPTVKKVLDDTQINPHNLEFEITESVFISSMEYVIEVMNEIKKLGICIALDDFGTGYSSLNYLQRLPIDTLKIDKTFIDSIINTKIEKQIVGSIISLVHKMDISVVAEGVENEKQLDYLKSQQCDFIQGYLWGKPLSDDQVSQLLVDSACSG